MEHFFKDAKAMARFRDNPLGIYIDAFADWLHEQGYTHFSGNPRIRIAAGFSNWVQQNDIPVKNITEAHVQQYLSSRKQRPVNDDVPGLNRFVDLLRRHGVIENVDVPLPKPNAVQLLADEFARYLRQERALTAGATYNYTKFARRFLADRFHDGNPDLSVISAADIVGFVQRQAANLKKEQAKLMTCALRAFLRYARFQGYIDSNLVASVPTVPNWSVVPIPKYLSPDQVQRVLSCCNRRTAQGRRDYAILLLLARLGLRGGAIVSLQLEDIDWCAGSITVHGKGKEIQLPLPPEVGEAIAAYLQNGRLQVKSRSVFLRSKAPICGFTKANAVSYIVERALARAGIEVPSNGAHQFRHTLATEMLRAGANLTEIGEVLGHRNPSSTTIYAKVDLVSLRKLALAWPGGEK